MPGGGRTHRELRADGTGLRQRVRGAAPAGTRPRQARVLLVESLAAGQRTLEHRGRILAELRKAVLARLSAKDAPGPAQFAAEAATGAVLALLHARTVKGKPAPFIDMLGPVMGIIAFARVQMPAVEREIERGDALARKIAAPEGSRPKTVGTQGRRRMFCDRPRERMSRPRAWAPGLHARRSSAAPPQSLADGPRAHPRPRCRER
jgi:hypothetical protein